MGIGDQVVAVQFFRLLPVVDDRADERIGIDVEHRAFHLPRPPQDLRVVGAAPVRVAVIGKPLSYIDAVAAAGNPKGFFDADALPVRPGQRHDHLVAIAELVGGCGAFEDRVVIGFRAFAEGVEPGPDEPEFTTPGVEQLHEHVRLVFGDRVVQQARLLQRAAIGADLDFEDVRAHADRSDARLHFGRRRFRQCRRLVGHGRRSGVFRRQRRGAQLIGRRYAFAFGGRRAGSWLRTIVLHPGLVGHP